MKHLRVAALRCDVLPQGASCHHLPDLPSSASPADRPSLVSCLQDHPTAEGGTADRGEGTHPAPEVVLRVLHARWGSATRRATAFQTPRNRLVVLQTCLLEDRSPGAVAGGTGRVPHLQSHPLRRLHTPGHLRRSRQEVALQRVGRRGHLVRAALLAGGVRASHPVRGRGGHRSQNRPLRPLQTGRRGSAAALADPTWTTGTLLQTDRQGAPVVRRRVLRP